MRMFGVKDGVEFLSLENLALAAHAQICGEGLVTSLGSWWVGLCSAGSCCMGACEMHLLTCFRGSSGF